MSGECLSSGGHVEGMKGLAKDEEQVVGHHKMDLDPAHLKLRLEPCQPLAL